ncbi:MAG: hypothetical protein U0350_36335 [Caldilineaceae bacterium]
MKQRLSLGLLIVAMLAAMALVGQLPTNAAPGDAPAFAVTPVTFSNNGGRAQDGPRIITYFDGTPAAYLTPVVNCYDTRAYNTLDIVYTSASVAAVSIDQTYGNDTNVLALGGSIINNNATPVVTPAVVQLPNFNAYNCVKVVSANATPISVYVKALGK